MPDSLPHAPAAVPAIVPTAMGPDTIAHQTGGVATYGQRLSNDFGWAMREGDLYFQGRGGAHDALKRISKRLNELHIPYAVAGGMALFFHGFRRFTEDVDLLVTAEDLKRIHEELEGRGYVRPFSKSKNLRDTEVGVKIEFLIAGQYPGDGKPKAIAFPNPADVSIDREGISYLSLPALVSLKLASGMTSPDRAKDISDVQELIKLLNLTANLSENLHPFVRGKYLELFATVPSKPKRYARLWRNKWLTADATTLDAMIDALKTAAAELEAMRADGVVLDVDSGSGDDYADLVTTDPEVAKKYGMELDDESDRQDEPSGSADDGDSQ